MTAGVLEEEHSCANKISPRKQGAFALFVTIILCLTAVQCFSIVKHYHSTAPNSTKKVKTSNATVVNNDLGKVVGDRADVSPGAWSEFLHVNNMFAGAREWHANWNEVVSTKGKQRGVQTDVHMHDEYVELAVKNASDAAWQHITDMKQRYASVGALADFYARGIGWIQDVRRKPLV